MTQDELIAAARAAGARAADRYVGALGRLEPPADIAVLLQGAVDATIPPGFEPGREDRAAIFGAVLIGMNERLGVLIAGQKQSGGRA